MYWKLRNLAMLKPISLIFPASMCGALVFDLRVLSLVPFFNGSIKLLLDRCAYSVGYAGSKWFAFCSISTLQVASKRIGACAIQWTRTGPKISCSAIVALLVIASKICDRPAACHCSYWQSAFPQALVIVSITVANTRLSSKTYSPNWRNIFLRTQQSWSCL